MSEARNPSIIEQAAKRLAELQRAGVDPNADATAARPKPDGASAMERAVGRLSAVEPSPFRQPGTAPAQSPPGAQRAVPRAEPLAPAIAVARSKSVEINLVALEAAGFISPTQPMTQLSEEMRVIKRPLLQNLQGHDGQPAAPRSNLIMVTSSVDGEGKTFAAINLAMSMAMELDRTVLLVDADVARPSLFQRLGLPVSKGLLDVLSEEAVPVADCILRTNIEKLTLLAAGTSHPRATELLASEAMSRLVRELAERYPDRVVIFDTPPLLASTESRVLAAHMGQVLVVVEADRTAQAKINEAMAALESCPLVFTVLNKARKAAADGPYGPYRH